MKSQLLALATIVFFATACGQSSENAEEKKAEEKMEKLKLESAKADEAAAELQAEIDNMTAPSSVKLSISGMTSEEDGELIMQEVIGLNGVLNGMCDSRAGIAKFGYDGAVIHYEKIIEHIGTLEGGKFQVNDSGVMAGVLLDYN